MAARVPGIIKHRKKNHDITYLRRAKEACSNRQIIQAFRNFVLYFDSLDNPLESTEDIQAIFTTTVCQMGSMLDEMCSAGLCEVEELIKCYVQALNFFPDNYLILNHFGAYMFKISEIDIARRYLEKAVEVNKDYLPSEINLMRVKWQQIPRWHYRMLNDKRRNLAYDRAIEEHVNQGFKNVVDIGSGTGLLTLSALRHEGVEVAVFEENKCLINISQKVFMANNVPEVKMFSFNSVNLPVSQDQYNLLVTEVFDVALFGEKALETILHALTVLRAPDFRIIPCWARVYITGISSTELLSKHQCVSSKSLELLNLQNVRISEHDGEPYEAELLSQLDVTYLTASLPIMEINFSNPQDILQIINKENCSNEMYIKCLKEGTLHAFAVWFDLHLTNNISLTTNPLSDECVTCWEQAVIYLDRPVQVKEGQFLRFTYAVRDSKLCVEHIYDDEDPKVHLKVSKEIISFLNDESLVDCMVRLADELRGSTSVMVDCNVMPLLGLLLAKGTNCIIWHIVKNMEDTPFFNYVLSQNDISEKRFIVTSQTEINFERINWLVFFDVVSTDGSLEYFAGKHLTEELQMPKIPQRVIINVQLIHSPYIDRCNKVMDENVLDFRIGEFINEYAGYEHPNLERFDYSERSEPVRFLRESNSEQSKNAVVTEGGLVNAMYVWYDLQFYNEIVFSTKHSTHYKKTCFFLSSPKTVEVGDSLCIKMQLHGSYLKFSL